MPRAVIVGVGMTPFGRHPDTEFEDLACDAIEMALDDAQMDFKEIQQAFCSRVFLPASTGARVMERMGRTSISCPDIEGACAAAAVGLRQAVMMIESEQCDVALAFGVEKMPRGFMAPEVLYESWMCRAGFTQNPQYWGLNARRHMHEYGTTERQLALVAVKAKKNGALNPYAYFREPQTEEEILASPLVADPLRRNMICTPDEGAAAAIVVHERIAQRYSAQPIEVAACVHRVSSYPLANACSFCATPTGNRSVYRDTSEAAYALAGLGPSDIDVAEVQDTDAFSEIEFYEELGFCDPGEGGKLIEEGVTEIGGRLPVNPSGGLQAKGEPVGASHFGQIFEIVNQLRGRCGARQVEGARVGLAHVMGIRGHCGVTILKA